jgi:hypothetical protein
VNIEKGGTIYEQRSNEKNQKDVGVAEIQTKIDIT